PAQHLVLVRCAAGPGARPCASMEAAALFIPRDPGRVPADGRMGAGPRQLRDGSGVSIGASVGRRSWSAPLSLLRVRAQGLPNGKRALRKDPDGGLMALAERYAGRTIAQALEAQAAEGPDRVFLLYGDRRFTYGQIEAKASALAAALHELGI